MTTRLEAALEAQLATAADHAPEPGERFVEGVRRMRLAHRRRRIVASGVAVAVVLAGGAAVAYRLPVQHRGAVPAASAPMPASTLPDFATLKSPEVLWPDAVHRLPGTLPDGSAYTVVSVLGNSRYVVERDPADGPVLFDAAANTARDLGVPAPGTDLTFAMPAVAGDRVVWPVPVDGADGSHWNMMVAPLDGSAPARVLAAMGGPKSESYGVAGNNVFWMPIKPDGGSGGVYEVPATGGTAHLVAGSEHYLVRGLSPWVASGEYGVDSAAVRAGTLWNLSTGRHVTWRLDPRCAPGQCTCDPVACYGVSADQHLIMQMADGTGYRKTDYTADPSGPVADPILGGQVSVLQLRLANGRRVHVFWDHLTGQAASLEPQDRSSWGFEHTVYTWPGTGGGLNVLDLSAIG